MNDADAMRPVIEMDTKVGRLKGMWRGPQAVAAGEVVDVELDLPRARSFTELVVDPPEKAVPGRLRGVVAAIYDDGAIVLQVGTSAVQVELEDGSSAADIVGADLDLEADDLEFFPSGV